MKGRGSFFGVHIQTQTASHSQHNEIPATKVQSSVQSEAHHQTHRDERASDDDSMMMMAVPSTFHLVVPPRQTHAYHARS